MFTLDEIVKATSADVYKEEKNDFCAVVTDKAFGIYTLQNGLTIRIGYVLPILACRHGSFRCSNGENHHLLLGVNLCIGQDEVGNRAICAIGIDHQCFGFAKFDIIIILFHGLTIGIDLHIPISASLNMKPNGIDGIQLEVQPLRLG